MKRWLYLQYWFFVESYKYQHPRGFKEHIEYICYYPVALNKFMKAKYDK